MQLVKVPWKQKQGWDPGVPHPLQFPGVRRGSDIPPHFHCSAVSTLPKPFLLLMEQGRANVTVTSDGALSHRAMRLSLPHESLQLAQTGSL